MAYIYLHFFGSLLGVASGHWALIGSVDWHPDVWWKDIPREKRRFQGQLLKTFTRKQLLPRSVRNGLKIPIQTWKPTKHHGVLYKWFLFLSSPCIFKAPLRNLIKTKSFEVSIKIAQLEGPYLSWKKKPTEDPTVDPLEFSPSGSSSWNLPKDFCELGRNLFSKKADTKIKNFLGGGFEYFLFSPLFGEDSHVD